MFRPYLKTKSYQLLKMAQSTSCSLPDLRAIFDELSKRKRSHSLVPYIEVGKLLESAEEEGRRRIKVGKQKKCDYVLRRQQEGFFDWPSTVAPASDRGWSGNVFSYKEGLLSYVGYHVGNEGVPEDIRLQLLDCVFHNDLPGVQSPDYMAEWGLPKSTDRLRKMAEAIAAFTRNAKGKSADYSEATANWESDLDYLFHKYYLKRFKFGWPSSAGTRHRIARDRGEPEIPAPEQRSLGEWQPGVSAHSNDEPRVENGAMGKVDPLYGRDTDAASPPDDEDGYEPADYQEPIGSLEGAGLYEYDFSDDPPVELLISAPYSETSWDLDLELDLEQSDKDEDGNQLDEQHREGDLAHEHLEDWPRARGRRRYGESLDDEWYGPDYEAGSTLTRSPEDDSSIIGNIGEDPYASHLDGVNDVEMNRLDDYESDYWENDAGDDGPTQSEESEQK